MDLTDGYIGISKNFEERMKQHHRDAFVRNSIYTVHEKMRMYNDDVITSKIFEGSINECFEYEEELRPRWRMGWNMAIGGGRPGSGWKPGNWLDNRLWHREHGEETICSTMTPTDMARKYVKNGMNRHVGGFIKVLYGQGLQAYGWELADAQLVMKVKARRNQVWNEIYIRQVDNKKQVVYVTREGAKHFYKEYNTNAALSSLKHLWIGAQKSCKGWELSTKEEWLATAERVEFK